MRSHVEDRATLAGVTVEPAEMSSLLPARYQMAFSLGWHIVIARSGWRSRR